jgi:biopolymer transport protein ExbB
MAAEVLVETGVRRSMSVNELAQKLGDACYGLLAINFLWGLYCCVLIWRRVGQLRFKNEEVETAFVDDVSELVKQKNWDEAINTCDYDYRAVPRLTLVMLTNRDLDLSLLRQLVTSKLQREILTDIERRLSWIVTVIKSGPLLGLFGTVLGMMAAFGRIGTGEKVQPSQIADEISVALICTAMGLATAIPLGYVLSTLNNRFRDLQEAMNGSLTRLLDVISKNSSSSRK